MLLDRKILTVAKYEYLRTVKRIGFLISTLSVPALFVVVIIVQLVSGIQAEEHLTKLNKDIKQISVIDEAGIIDSRLIQPPLKLTNTSKTEAISNVQNQQIDAAIYYPKSVIDDGKFEVHAKDLGILGGQSFQEVGTKLLSESAKAALTNSKYKQLLTAEITGSSNFYDQTGKLVDYSFEKFLLPIFSFMLFIMSVFVSAQYLLQSVSEEKENRMIELILSTIKPATLIYGKIIGLAGVVLTQIFIWTIPGPLIGIIGLKLTNTNLPIDINKLQLSALPFNLFMILAAFLLFAAIMVGVGAIATSYRDSQSLSSVFILLAIFPLYFMSVLLAEPSGIIAQFFTYFPLTSPMVFLIRNSLNALTLPEQVIGVFIVTIYVVVAFWISSKMFKIGSLMYNRRPTLKEIFFYLRY